MNEQNNRWNYILSANILTPIAQFNTPWRSAQLECLNWCFFFFFLNYQLSCKHWDSHYLYTYVHTGWSSTIYRGNKTTNTQRGLGGGQNSPLPPPPSLVSFLSILPDIFSLFKDLLILKIMYMDVSVYAVDSPWNWSYGGLWVRSNPHSRQEQNF